MRTLLSLIALGAFALGPLATPADAQSSSMDEVHLFQSFFRDAPISAFPYVEGGASYNDADIASIITVDIRAGIPIQDVFELGARGTFLSVDHEVLGDESGIADVPVYGRYNLLQDPTTKASIGGFLTLPVGDEEPPLFQGNLDFGFFGALRHYLNNNIGLTGNVGIDFLEAGEDDRETSLNIGGGIIGRATDQLHLIGEMQFQTETDYAALSGGVDYQISDAARIRGALLVGVDDGAPDVGLQGGVLLAIH